jgi:small subunit ribosomal protein S13
MKLVGTEIKEKQHILIGLQQIYGIGKTKAKEILSKLNIPETTKVKDLTAEEQVKLTEELDTHILGNDLERIVIDNINKLVEKRCLRGIRHQKGLPVRGQRTKTNCQTCKRVSFFRKSSSTSKVQKQNKQNVKKR